MQRVYGTAFLSEKDLKAHLTQIEEAKKRDHRKIGRELGLFWFHPWAPGEPFWLPKGTTLVHLLGNYMRDVLFPAGYVEVRAPLVFNKALWETSGHWSHYRQNMFLLEAPKDEDQAGLKPMNCPGHMLIFGSEVRSYRDLPMRIHEQSVLHRMEASGVLSGLTRVREFIMDDAHIFLRQDQIGEEVERLLRLVRRVYDDFGLTPEMKLSTRPEEFLGEKATWDEAESELKRALEAAGQEYTVNEGDGAFYGPKIDFAVTDALGRKWQCATIQLDYQLPQQFHLKYIGADNSRAPAGGDPSGDLRQLRAIHRTAARALRRRAATLAGAGADRRAADFRSSSAVCDSVRDELKAAGLRVELDERQEKIGYKIREAQLQKIPYMLVVGDREEAGAHRVGTDAGRRRPGRHSGRNFYRHCPRRKIELEGQSVEQRLELTGGLIAFDRSPRRDDRVRVNERIRVREIRVIDDTGQQLGIMPPPQALTIAKQKGLDLVEISPTACRRSAASWISGSISTRNRSARARRRSTRR